MPSSKHIDDQEINLLTALQTTFSKDADPEMFLARADDKIADLERTIIETCSKNRIRIDDNLYALLESRDAIAEQKQDIETATESASEITKNVDKAVTSLTEKMRVRQNLDAALAVAAQTRKLTRMYARIEDTIDSRRLYTAFRMLKMLEEETRSVKPGTILQELVPDSHRLKSTITLHARKAFHSWLSTVPRAEIELGAYALHHVNKKAASSTNLVTSSRLGSIYEASSQLQGLAPSKLNPDTSSISGRARSWSPLLSSNPTHPSTSLQRNVPQRSYSSHRVGMASSVPGPLPQQSLFRQDVGHDNRASSMRSFAHECNDEVPTLHLRPLLQSVLVNNGLELLADMRAEYRRERHGHLKKILEDIIGLSAEAMLQDRESAHQMASARAREVETFVFRVCGFFVVERSVEKHADPTVVQRAVVNEWWSMAYPRVNALLKEQEDGATHSPADRAWARSLQSRVDMLAETNELSAVIPSMRDKLLEQWKEF